MACVSSGQAKSFFLTMLNKSSGKEVFGRLLLLGNDILLRKATALSFPIRESRYGGSNRIEVAALLSNKL